MEAGVLVVGIIGVILLILIPFIFYGLRLAGYDKTAYLVCSTLFLIITVPMVNYSYRSEMYSQDDMIDDLHQAGIGFKNPVRMVSNSISGVKDMKQETVLLMDTADVHRIINRIETDNRYKISSEILSLKKELGANTHYISNRNYRFKNTYILETYGMKDEYTVRYTELKFQRNNDTVLFKKEEIY